MHACRNDTVDHPQVAPPAEITPPLTAAGVVDQASAGAPPAPRADDPFVGQELPPEEPFEEVRKRLLAGPRKSKGQRLVKPAESPQPAMTPEQRLLILDTWQRSGLPAGDFAPLVRLSKHTLYSWKKRFDESGPAGLMDQQRGGPNPTRTQTDRQEPVGTPARLGASQDPFEGDSGNALRRADHSRCLR